MPDREAPRAPIFESDDVSRRPSRGRAARRALGLVAAALVLAAGAGLAGLVADGGRGAAATAAEAPSGEALVRAAQRRLGVAADGVAGPATRTAVRAFQRGRGLPVTGRLDDATLVALGVVAEHGLRVLTTTVASTIPDGTRAEQASVPPEEPPVPTVTETVPAAPPAPAPSTTPTAPPEDEPVLDEEAEAEADPDDEAPVVGGALAGAPPPVIGGQLPDDAGLSQRPPREGETTRRDPGDARAEIPETGGLSPRPPKAEDAPISTQLRARLDRIARCESGGNPRAVSASGRYRGKYQFSRSTWRAVGGRGDPVDASEAEQDRRAAILYRRTGPSSWPVCGRA